MIAFLNYSRKQTTTSTEENLASMLAATNAASFSEKSDTADERE